MVINTMGHALLVDKLIQQKKIVKGNRIVYVGSEVSRNIYAFVPLLPAYDYPICGRGFRE